MQVDKYLHAYADFYALHDDVQMKTRVVSIRPTARMLSDSATPQPTARSAQHGGAGIICSSSNGSAHTGAISMSSSAVSDDLQQPAALNGAASSSAGMLGPGLSLPTPTDGGPASLASCPRWHLVTETVDLSTSGRLPVQGGQRTEVRNEPCLHGHSILLALDQSTGCPRQSMK